MESMPTQTLMPAPPPYIASYSEDEACNPRKKPFNLEGLQNNIHACHQHSSGAQFLAMLHIPQIEFVETSDCFCPLFTHQIQGNHASDLLYPKKMGGKMTEHELMTQAGACRKSTGDHDIKSQQQIQLHRNYSRKVNYNSLSRNSSPVEQNLIPPQSNVLKELQVSAIPKLRERRSASAQAKLAPSTSLPTIWDPCTSQNDSQSPSKKSLRRSWLSMDGRSRFNSWSSNEDDNTQVWVLLDDYQSEYNPSFLRTAEKVPELWDDNGNVYVYLYPRGSGCGPSFKVPEFVVSTSNVFNALIHSESDSLSRTRSTGCVGHQRLRVDDAGRMESPFTRSIIEDPDALRLHLPLTPTASAHLTTLDDGEPTHFGRLISIRNLFAFLTRQPLVGLKTRSKIFDAVLDVANLLQEFGFSSLDGSDFGEVAKLSFKYYLNQMGLSDCRHSPEKTIKALILGERMRCVDLYSEAFAHAAGMYSAIMDQQLSLFNQASLCTQQKLERAHLDLVSRQHSVNEHLEHFDFPSLFAGIANSKSTPELKLVRFKSWRNSFNKMRKFTLNHYRAEFGSWPPKVSNKVHPFTKNGLNRLALKALYADMCALYDLLVDRTMLTSRTMDELPVVSDNLSELSLSALRTILSEFDRSKPPVLPPIPFDVPRLPSVKDQSKMGRVFKEYELFPLLSESYNQDENGAGLPFISKFKDFEIRESRGNVLKNLVDQRIGYWLFLYAVLQSLPLLVVDAPGVKHTEDVEYFLCEPPMNNLPWVSDQEVRKMWYEVIGGGGLVELSADAVMFSIQATYHRSYCWIAAKQWEDLNSADEPPLEEPLGLLLQHSATSSRNSTPLSGSSVQSPLPGDSHHALHSTRFSTSQQASQFSRLSIAMGLEPITFESENVLGSHNPNNPVDRRLPHKHLSMRTSSSVNLVYPTGRDHSMALQAKSVTTSGATFDDILAKVDPKPVTTKVRSRFRRHK
ncbi:hypothetical protein QQS21_004104 [Conoideocrella luteorostrata]|uniref:DUF8004 domain-containing protein n=1 Tax=Conoideocrella luteorostrata TaxID=1105319 RepID=A0AAJ0CS77_9HYPO|nr:hypothetical protein QQS21_004104 [Conoideocrella luteorostrata]